MPFILDIDDVVGEAISGAASANASAAANTAGPALLGGAGILRIEPAQVDAAIGIFEGALSKLENKVQQARAQIRADAMAADRVSQPAAAAFNDASLGGVGAAVQAWTGAVDELRAIIQQLKAAKEANVMTDDTVSQPFASA